jgi:FlaA1/EpsC-like NDP-sugar epimerase
MGTIAETCRGLSQARIQTLVPATRPVATALLLSLADAVALLTAGCLGVECWNLVNSTVGVEFYLRLWPALGVFLLAYASLGLYPAVGMSPVEELRRTVLGATVVYLVSAVSIFLSKDLGTYSRGVFLSSWVCSIILVPSSRALVRELFAAKPWWGVPVLVFGTGEAARMVIARLQAQPELGLKLVACLDDDTQETTCSGLPVAGPLSAAPELSRMLRIRHALVAMPRLKRQELISVLERMCTTFTHVIVVPDLFGIASLWISAKDLGGVLGLEVKQNLLVPVNRWLKRGLDLVVASVAGIVALPIVGVAVLWIKRVSPGSAFYTQ